MFGMNMSPLFETIMLIAGVIYLVTCILNYFTVFAFLQRRVLLKSREKALEHYLHSLLFSCGGFLTLVNILRITNFPEYGIKFWPGEHKRFNEEWANKLSESIRAKAMGIRHLRTPRVDGRCDSIW